MKVSMRRWRALGALTVAAAGVAAPGSAAGPAAGEGPVQQTQDVGVLNPEMSAKHSVPSSTRQRRCGSLSVHSTASGATCRPSAPSSLGAATSARPSVRPHLSSMSARPPRVRAEAVRARGTGQAVWMRLEVKRSRRCRCW
jgi:hypothetical protein